VGRKLPEEDRDILSKGENCSVVRSLLLRGRFFVTKQIMRIKEEELFSFIITSTKIIHL